jgi:uncharacterized protein YjbI with pentapeptide repeats
VPIRAEFDSAEFDNAEFDNAEFDNAEFDSALFVSGAGADSMIQTIDAASCTRTNRPGAG